MGMMRHFFRVLQKPYHVAAGETIGDYVDALVPELIRSPTDGTRLARALIGLDSFVETLAKNNDRGTVMLAAEHWAARVSSPSSVRAIRAVFGVPERYMNIVLPLQRESLPVGRGLHIFQQGLKDAGVIQAITYLEELDQQGIAPLPPLTFG